MCNSPFALNWCQDKCFVMLLLWHLWPIHAYVCDCQLVQCGKRDAISLLSIKIYLRAYNRKRPLEVWIHQKYAIRTFSKNRTMVLSAQWKQMWVTCTCVWSQEVLLFQFGFVLQDSISIMFKSVFPIASVEVQNERRAFFKKKTEKTPLEGRRFNEFTTCPVSSTPAPFKKIEAVLNLSRVTSHSNGV